MDAERRVTQQKLSVLQLTEALGNVSEACRQRGVSRTQFYEYKRRFQTHGIEGLKDLPPIPKFNPNTTPPEHVDRILAIKPGTSQLGLQQAVRYPGVGNDQKSPFPPSRTF
jgi:hypothetical protein